MPKKYYTDTTTYPNIFKPIIERIQYFICKELLYPDETYADPHPKFILAEQTDDAFRLASKRNRKTNFTIPFTAYNIKGIEVDDERLNVNSKLGLYYAHGYSSFIDATASILNIPMMSVFNQFNDFLTAYTILNDVSTDNKKITVPCTINGIVTSFNVYIAFDISDGPYAGELLEHNRVGKINTIQHDLRVYFHNPVLDTSIAPVDNIEVTLYSYTNDDYRDNIEVSSGLVATTPSISSTTPPSGTVDFAVNSGIVLNFNTPMDEDSGDENLYVDPQFLFETTWNAATTSVTIDPHTDLTSGTVYTVTMYDDVQSSKGVNMEEDYDLEFTTV